MSVRTRLPKGHQPLGFTCRTPTAQTKTLPLPARSRQLKPTSRTQLFRRPKDSFSFINLVTSSCLVPTTLPTPVDLSTPVAGCKTVVFDLDETLVHCLKKGDKQVPDVVLSIEKPSGELVKASLAVRPFALECLREASRSFEIVVFTASQAYYADPVIDWLDPTGELVHHRLYRDSCVEVSGVQVKDLRVIANRALQDIVIVDNSICSFAYNLDNGIPIRPWLGDKHDRELLKLLDYFQVLEAAKDVRDVNRCKFHLSLYCQEYRKTTQFV